MSTSVAGLLLNAVAAGLPRGAPSAGCLLEVDAQATQAAAAASTPGR